MRGVFEALFARNGLNDQGNRGIGVWYKVKKMLNLITEMLNQWRAVATRKVRFIIAAFLGNCVWIW